MLVIDLIIVALVLGLAVWGFSRGFAVGALALLGFGGGAVLGSRLAPLVLDEGVHSVYAPILALPAALLVGGLLAAVLERLGLRLGRRVGSLGPLDGIAGALLTGCLGLVTAWLLGAVVAQIHGLRDPLAHSAILKRLNAVLPPPGPVLVAQTKPFPSLPTYEGPPPKVARPDPKVRRDADVLTAARSVGLILVSGCAGGKLGSGWIAAPGIVVTNVHVVTGGDIIFVRLHKQEDEHEATPILLDRKEDIALLRVPELSGEATLRLVAKPKFGTSGAVLGYPLANWSINPARIGETSTETPGAVREAPETPGRKLFGRLITQFLGSTLPGNSGGPLVDRKGRVLGTVFAGGGSSGLAVGNRIVRRDLDRVGSRSRKVSTGRCHGDEETD